MRSVPRCVVSYHCDAMWCHLPAITGATFTWHVHAHTWSSWLLRWGMQEVSRVVQPLSACEPSPQRRCRGTGRGVLRQRPSEQRLLPRPLAQREPAVPAGQGIRQEALLPAQAVLLGPLPRILQELVQQSVHARFHFTCTSVAHVTLRRVSCRRCATAALRHDRARAAALCDGSQRVMTRGGTA